MIDLLGKRPFKGRSDDMDKYLDEEAARRRGQSSAPPPLPQDIPPNVSLAANPIEISKQ